jgi:hypothetical protein
MNVLAGYASSSWFVLSGGDMMRAYFLILKQAKMMRNLTMMHRSMARITVLHRIMMRLFK